MYFRLAILTILLTVTLANKSSTKSSKVYQVLIMTTEDAKVLRNVSNKIDLWSVPNDLHTATDIMVEPNFQNEFETLLKENNIAFAVTIDDVESTIFAENSVNERSYLDVPLGQITFNKYHQFGKIEAYLNRLNEDFPHIAEVQVIGKSTQGRDVTLIKISTGGDYKSSIFIEAGLHAREWIAPAVATYLINQLVENETNHRLIENMDWYILPVLNPDGYEYTHTNDRLWRKTRSKQNNCYGVDGNRNFDFHWMEVGSGIDECSFIFSGRTPFSEPETCALRRFILKHNANMKAYVSLHSYGQYILHPWGFTSDPPDNINELEEVGHKIKMAIQSHSCTTYKVGSPGGVIYEAGGGSIDWAMGAAGINLTYTIELPGGGNMGFDLPPSQILKVCEETWLGFKALHDHAVEKI